jgi:hypothetical protein
MYKENNVVLLNRNIKSRDRVLKSGETLRATLMFLCREKEREGQPGQPVLPEDRRGNLVVR